MLVWHWNAKRRSSGDPCMKHPFIGFGVQSGLVPEVQEISLNLAPRSLWEFTQTSYPISSWGSPIWKRLENDNLAGLWGTVVEVCKIFFTSCMQCEGDAQLLSTCSYAFLLHYATKPWDANVLCAFVSCRDPFTSMCTGLFENSLEV